MRFDIEGFITFDSENAYLVNRLTGDRVDLSQTSSRLLNVLLNHHGDILSRNEIFQSVFDKFGARASNSNLNQYISILRRTLNDLGVEKEIIVTVPRVGFKISKKATVVHAEDQVNSVVDRALPAGPSVVHHPKAYFFLAGAIMLAIILALLTASPDKKNTSAGVTTRVQGKCVFYGFSSSSLQEIKNSFDLIGRQLNCSTPKDIYLYNKKIDSELGNITQLLITECDKKKDICTSVYIRDIKNV
ncbi:winged helix-turn-helix domain-containing protein [Erwinia tasmaniensis]|uniref:Transcriptional regulatory protein n=1 Tax=Erwinia tasmaniensis (strain DSM 17950 / CFBP 7177 / CIP 109463 / NCPPB 4357 / Et1/99) TaxID=465817 RepID=B2VCU4_ERWT9|nr:winged helix-turn-helix domain-containing protein [Erwinia tasmaniensis]CAO98049.1 Putative transcriptional regulatory protein [Erwinia tasmaniensis Et1/99]